MESQNTARASTKVSIYLRGQKKQVFMISLLGHTPTLFDSNYAWRPEGLNLSTYFLS